MTRRRDSEQNEDDVLTYLDEPWVRTPAIYDTPVYVSELAVLPIQLVQATTCCTAAILWVLRECNRTLDAVRLHLFRCFVRQGIRITECDIGFVWGSLRTELI